MFDSNDIEVKYTIHLNDGSTKSIRWFVSKYKVNVEAFNIMKDGFQVQNPQGGLVNEFYPPHAILKVVSEVL